MPYVIGIDIGGTFTDCVVARRGGGVVIAKALSTSPSFEDGVIDAIEAAAWKLGIRTSELLSDAQVFHGCTVGTNALVEGRISKVGLLVTAGHTETFFIMRAGKRLHGMTPEYIAAISKHDKPEPLVPRDRVVEVHERVTFDGTVLVALDPKQVEQAVDRLVEAGAEAFAVSLLWSVVNGEHEAAVARIIEERVPGAFVSCSRDVAPRLGEYERTVAAVINSGVGPIMATYLQALEKRLAEAGYAKDLGIMSCWGGLIDSSDAERFPLLTIGSGPAAGVVAGGIVSSLGPQKHSSIITADMGGTSLDVGVVIDKQAAMRSTSRLGQYEYAVPTLDVKSIGAGGGSIIRYDEAMRTLRVGPRSAGSRPGPAAFGRGGIDATVTDADLVLGYLDVKSMVGGSMALDIDAARRALERVGASMGYGADETAAAAVRIVDSQMADALRLVSVNQGYDPRRFVLYAYGGNGPVHATGVAREVGISHVCIPLGDLAAGWSGFGVAHADAVVVEEAGMTALYPFDASVFERVWCDLEAKVVERLGHQGVAEDAATLDRFVEMKYSVQVNQVRVAVPQKAFTLESVDALVEAFEIEYERLYGKDAGFRAAGFTVTSLGVRGSAKRSEPTFVRHKASAVAPDRKLDRAVIWYELGLERVVTPVFEGATVRTGMAFSGPAIIDFPDTTLVVRPGQEASVDEFGTITVVISEAVG